MQIASSFDAGRTSTKVHHRQVIESEKKLLFDLCEQAAHEQDSTKLLGLITRITKLLDMTRQRVEATEPTDGTG